MFLMKAMERTCASVAALLLVLLMFGTFIDVAGRNLFNRPLLGASELTEVALAAIIFLLLPEVGLKKQHIVIDLVDPLIGKLGKRVLDAFGAMVSAAIFAIMAYNLWILAGRAIGYGDATPSLGLPLGWVLYGTAFLTGLTSVAFLGSITSPYNSTSDDEPDISTSTI